MKGKETERNYSGSSHFKRYDLKLKYSCLVLRYVMILIWQIESFSLKTICEKSKNVLICSRGAVPLWNSLIEFLPYTVTCLLIFVLPVDYRYHFLSFLPIFSVYLSRGSIFVQSCDVIFNLTTSSYCLLSQHLQMGNLSMFWFTTKTLYVNW